MNTIFFFLSSLGMRDDEDDDLVGYQPRIQSTAADVFDRKGEKIDVK